MADAAAAPLPGPEAPRADLKAFLTRHGALLALGLLLLFNLAVTPNFAYSFAIDFINVMTPAFDAA